ncbi:MAG: hypothetical protein AAGI28_10495 [Pseudomonadota bacterium]
MERKVDDTAPDASTLYLAIGIGAFSVVASFLLAIYCSTTSNDEETAVTDANSIDATAPSSE